MTAPSGWYPDSNSPGTERYWDGAQWTEQSRPIGSPAAPPPPPPGAQPFGSVPGSNTPAAPVADKNWFARHKILTGLGALFLIGIIATAAGGGGATDPENNASDNTPATSQSQSPASQPAASKPAATKAPEKPKETSGQRNARNAAKRYLEFAPFSRAGLIEQLSSSAGDGYSVADATYAVDAQHANWNEQAYKAAKKYLSFTSFSRTGLIEQLESAAGDKYTHAQAVYGADKALAE